MLEEAQLYEPNMVGEGVQNALTDRIRACNVGAESIGRPNQRVSVKVSEAFQLD